MLLIHLCTHACACQSTLKSRFEPELSLFIQLTLYRLSVWATGASYGAKLQDLKYTIPAIDGRGVCACDFLPRGSFSCIKKFTTPPGARSV
jgi:hypothetical protein